MSLKVWLPLNGDLENRGCTGEVITFIGTNNEWTTNGKIGNNCLHLTKGSGTIAVPSMAGSKQMSFAYWVKVNNAWSENWRDGIRWYSTNGSSDTYSRQEFYTNCTKVGVWFAGSPNSISGKTFTVGEWHHLAFTIDYTLGRADFYIDGALAGYTTGVSTDHYLKTGNFILGDSDGAGVDINMNDVRIYNHCLSAAEVKEISQGLVLHYKLDSNYIENTTNLYNGSFSNTCYNRAKSTYGYGENTDMYKTSGIFQGKECTKIYMGTAGVNAYPYVYFDAFATTGTNIQTLSFDYFPTTQTKIIPYSYNGTYNISYITSNNDKGQATNVSQIIIPVVLYQWNHISITMQKYDTTNTNRGNGYIRIGDARHTSTTTDYWLFANIQIENKDHETGYTASGTTRSTTLIQDSSGYEHNAVSNGSVSVAVDLDTPKYNYSAKFASGARIATTYSSSTFMPRDMLTVNIWFKSSNAVNRFLSCTESGGFNFESGSGYVRFPLYITGKGYTACVSSTTTWSALSDNKWHMITATYDRTQIKLYIDGNLDTTAASSYPNLDIGYNASTPFTLGAEAQTIASPIAGTYVGNLSDCRIYCTPLLDTDIKQLYNTNMKIDNLSNIHTFNIKEQITNLLAGVLITTYYGNRTTPFTDYDVNGEITLTGNRSIGSDYIPINPEGHIYEYDITYSSNTGNMFDIGFERFDANKTSRSNSACIYVRANTNGADHERIKGTVDLSTDGVNTCRYIALRVLNQWSGSSSGVTGTATIHNMSLREITIPHNHSQLTEQGNFIIDEIKENQKASFYKNGIVEAHNFIEK